MLTVGDSVDRAWGPEVAEGLQRFAEPPDWLLALDDAGRVSETLVRWVPELGSGRMALSDLEVERVRLRNGRWMAQYTLQISEGDERRTVALRARRVDSDEVEPLPGSNSEPLGSEGWACYSPDLRLEFRTELTDAVLTSLPALTDPDRARALLQEGIRSASPEYADLSIADCRPQVMRYKPGSRCTVLYHLEYPPEGRARGWPNPVVAKTHHGPKGLNAHESMRALWESPLRASRNVTVAEPLGFLPEENVLLQGPIKEERTLKQQLRRSLAGGTAEDLVELCSYLEKTGQGLADLHGCGVTAGVVWTFEDEEAEVRERIDRLTHYAPPLMGAGEPLLARLEAIAAAHPADPLVPSHRSFRPAQVLIHGSEIGFIDFDSFCRAEPALDLSLFCSTVRDLSLRALQARDGRPGPGEPASSEHLGMLDDLCDAFLGGYRATATVQWSPERVDLWQALLVFDRVITCWTKNRFERLPHCMSLLTHLFARDGLKRLVA
jgi:hypothetical protein